MADDHLNDLLTDLADDAEPVSDRDLTPLSNLSREQQHALDDVWTQISLDKRRLLVAALTEAGDEDIQLDYSAVFRRGLRDDDAEVRRASIDGLWENENVTLIRPFLRLLDDSDTAVRASAATALGRFVLQGELGHLTEERYDEILSRLRAIIAEPSVPISVRRRAVESIAYSSTSDVRDIIARGYEDADPEMRQSAIFAMGRSADHYWRGQVRVELRNEGPAFRYEAARAAGELADPQAVPALARLLRDDVLAVREMAIWALGQIGGSAARQALQLFIEQDKSALTDHARDSLAEMALLSGDLTSPFLGEDPLAE